MNVDPTTLDRIKQIHPKLRSDLECIYGEIARTVNSEFCRVRFAQVFRTHQQQAELYAKGRTAPGPKVTWAKPGQSYHNYGLAVDIVLVVDRDKNGTFEAASWDTTFDGDRDGVADWLEVAKIFNSWGWQWGLINSKGKRYDLPHFQKTLGFSISQLSALPKDANGYPILE